MWWAFILMCLCFFVAYLIIKSCNKPIPELERAYEGMRGKIDTTRCTYLGGFSDVSINNNLCSLLFFKDRLKFVFLRNQEVTVIKEVSKDNIIDVSFVTENYLKDKINMGALLVFGWIGAIALKDKKQMKNEYVLITIKNKDKEQGIVLDGNTVISTSEGLLNLIKRNIE